MRFFDAHCDAVMHIEDGDFDFVAGKGRSHMDLPRLLAAGHCAQVFAIFAPASYYPGRDLRAFAEQAIAAIHGWAGASDGRLQVAGQRMETDKRIAAISSVHPLSSVAPLLALIGLEGADPLQGRAENLRHFFELGVRLVIPAWDDNAFSGSSAGPGHGLTAEGITLIELCAGTRCDGRCVARLGRSLRADRWDRSTGRSLPAIPTVGRCARSPGT